MAQEGSSAGSGEGDNRRSRSGSSASPKVPLGRAGQSFGSEATRSDYDALYSNMHAINLKLEKLESNLGDLLGKVDSIHSRMPYIDHVYGFSVHTAPHLATKADVVSSKSEVIAELSPKIEERLKSSTLLNGSLLIIAIMAAVAAYAAIPPEDWKMIWSWFH